MLDERGDVTFSMRELAGRIGYAVTAVYRCYETRGHLLRVLTVHLFEMLGERLTEDDLGGTVQEQISRIGERFLEWAVTYPGRYRLMFEYTEPEAELNEEESAVARSGLRFLEGLIQAAQDRSEISAIIDASVLAPMLFANLHGLASLHNGGRLEGQAGEDIVVFYQEVGAGFIASLIPAAA